MPIYSIQIYVCINIDTERERERETINPLRGLFWTPIAQLGAMAPHDGAVKLAIDLGHTPTGVIKGLRVAQQGFFREFGFLQRALSIEAMSGEVRPSTHLEKLRSCELLATVSTKDPRAV